MTFNINLYTQKERGIKARAGFHQWSKVLLLWVIQISHGDSYNSTSLKPQSQPQLI